MTIPPQTDLFSSVDSPPFFIVGAMRSGTTLLRLMLASHPRIAIPPESHFIPDLIELERLTRDLSNIRKKIVEWLATHDRVRDFGIPTVELRQLLMDVEPFTARNITTAVFDEYARLEGKSRWGDKTPRYRRYMTQLRTLYPTAKFIHVLRDGRDAAMSACAADFGPKSWVEAAHAWRNSVRRAWEQSRDLGDSSYLEVRYEKLIQNPREVLQVVCEFLGENFSPQMLDCRRRINKLVPDLGNPAFSRLAFPVDPLNSGKWRSQLSEEQILLFEIVAGAELEKANYPRVHCIPSFSKYYSAQCKRAFYLARQKLIEGKDRLTENILKTACRLLYGMARRISGALAMRCIRRHHVESAKKPALSVSKGLPNQSHQLISDMNLQTVPEQSRHSS